MTQSLPQLVREIASGFPDAVASSASGSPGAGPAVAASTWSRAGVAFAVLNSSAIEIRLETTIAAAATRTPDTAPSPRGREWVRFSPRELDPHAIDRLRAWLELAHRLAAG